MACQAWNKAAPPPLPPPYPYLSHTWGTSCRRHVSLDDGVHGVDVRCPVHCAHARLTARLTALMIDSSPGLYCAHARLSRLTCGTHRLTAYLYSVNARFRARLTALLLNSPPSFLHPCTVYGVLHSQCAHCPAYFIHPRLTAQFLC